MVALIIPHAAITEAEALAKAERMLAFARERSGMAFRPGAAAKVACCILRWAAGDREENYLSFIFRAMEDARLSEPGN